MPLRNLRCRTRSFSQLMVMDTREMVRFPLIGVSMVTMMLILLVIHVSLWYAFTMMGAQPRVVVTGANAPTIAAELATEGIITTPAESGTHAVNSRVEVDADGATVTLLESGVAWDPIWQALRTAGLAAEHIRVIDSVGDEVPDFLRVNLGTTLLAGIASIALIGTAVPIIAMRERGALRLIATTPTPRWLYLVSLLPLRLALVTVTSVGIAIIAIARQYADPGAMGVLTVTIACGAVMLFGVAALVASRGANTDAAQQALVTVILALVFSSGGAVPLTLLPEPVRVGLGLLPGSWFVGTVNEAIAGMPAALPFAVAWALMLLLGGTCAVAASRRFRWDGPSGKSDRAIALRAQTPIDPLSRERTMS
ncbi:ABC transporter permease [Microbacterium sp. ZW T5_56]|uniref:ABC transporter permease n=1 Tax=Microbacterium sp. ZW T5_56 TaxID=3378081 RepID=UPI0038523B47